MDILEKIYLKSLFPKSEIIYNINAPMQCMMKGICGQCIQKTNDDQGYMFSCSCQYVKTENIDFDFINNRLSQNSLFEKLSTLQ